MRKAYLTIDDSPSVNTAALSDFLAGRDIQALLFCRGDRLAEDPEAVVYAVKKGQVLANHMYSHPRTSTLSLAEAIQEITATEALIEDVYRRAGKARPGKYFRFPHMDRGCGGWIVDYNAYPAYRDNLQEIFMAGLNVRPEEPSPVDREKKRRLQDWLKKEGFTSPFTGVTLPWFVNTEAADAMDCMYTFSTNDWMLTQRHRGRWPYKTPDDLKRKIDEDPWLADESSRHIILAHDQDDIGYILLELIIYLQDKGFEFLSVEQE